MTTKAISTKASRGWFDVDRDGLAKICERRGKAFVLHELISNSLDTGAKQIDVILSPLPGGLTAMLTVEDDDPDGFKDIAYAYTLFAPSPKAGVATLRGRYDIGEKLVLSLCDTAKVVSTKGAVSFGPAGRRALPERRPVGSIFVAKVRMTADEVEQVITSAKTLLCPQGVRVTINNEVLRYREPLKIVDATLFTEIADSNGNLRRSERKTTVEIHEPLVGEKPTLYELGVPVIATGDRWSLNVKQRVPLNVERDNILPAYLRDVRAVALNAMAGRLTPDDAGEGWVAAALEDETITKEAVNSALTARFGEKRVTADPSDREAENRAKGAGYTVIPAGSFSKEAWKNIRAHEGAQPAGRMFPTQSDGATDGEHGPRKLIAVADWTPGMVAVATYCKAVLRRLIDKEVSIAIANDSGWGVLATWQSIGAILTFNAGKLGKAWFRADNREAISNLMLHEASHDADGGHNHLSDAYYHELSRLGAALGELFLRDPEIANIGRYEKAAAEEIRQRLQKSNGTSASQ